MNRSQWITWGAAGLAVAGISAVALAGGGSARGAADAPAEPAPLLSPALASTSSEAPVVHVYKSPTCGCCSAWIDHLRAEGFEVVAEDLGPADLDAVKDLHGIAPELRSCHTAVVDGYALEGHVPAQDVRRLLAERPEVAGLAVPGMPIGSPGMEMGDRRDPYDVVAFDRAGRTSVYRSY